MYGSFYSSEIGMFRMAATNYSSLVLIVYGEGKKLVVTPDRAEEFVAVVDSKKVKPFM